MTFERIFRKPIPVFLRIWNFFGIESDDVPVIAFLPLACVLEAVGKEFFPVSMKQTLLKLSDEVTSVFPNQSPQSLV